jgi:hypothetical protein
MHNKFVFFLQLFILFLPTHDVAFLLLTVN